MLAPSHQSVADARSSLPLCETLLERADAPRARFSLLGSMFVERGTRADWELLHELHYKAENLPMGPRFWRLDLHGETIGVLVSGNPKGMLKERHLAFPALRPKGKESKLVNTHRYKVINQSFRVISRFVIDTKFRGIGCGYRMMNLVSRMEGMPFMEIQSSMSKFNFFGQKAGFRFITPMNANKFDAGMRFLREHFASSPQDIEEILSEIEAMKPAHRERTLAACRYWYLRNSALENTTPTLRATSERRIAEMSARTIIKAIQQVALTSPLYGVWKNPDPAGSVPQRLPLLAFDAQGPNERLRYTGAEA